MSRAILFAARNRVSSSDWSGRDVQQQPRNLGRHGDGRMMRRLCGVPDL
jgi:hypothetical protein